MTNKEPRAILMQASRPQGAIELQVTRDDPPAREYALFDSPPDVGRLGLGCRDDDDCPCAAARSS